MSSELANNITVTKIYHVSSEILVLKKSLNISVIRLT